MTDFPSGSTADIAVFALVVVARLGIPLLIPRFPLPGIFLSMLIDTLDKTIFEQFTDMNLDGYQGYDKAFDIYYLAIAYVSVLRNWGSSTGFRIARFLWYYRLLGVFAFELSEERYLLLLFPNTFEYFFIFYEAVRIQWDPRRLSVNQLVGAAAGIWICIKLPQEYWLHIAKLDLSDELGGDIYTVIPFVIIAGILAMVFGLFVRSMPSPDWGFRLEVSEVEGPVKRAAVQPQASVSNRLLNSAVLEKVVLVSMLSVVFAQLVPDIGASLFQLSLGIGLVIVANAGISQWLTQRGTTWRSLVQEFAVMYGINLLLVSIYAFLLSRTGSSLNYTTVFALLLTLIVTLFDRYTGTSRATWPSPFEKETIQRIKTQ